MKRCLWLLLSFMCAFSPLRADLGPGVGPDVGTEALLLRPQEKKPKKWHSAWRYIAISVPIVTFFVVGMVLSTHNQGSPYQPHATQ